MCAGPAPALAASAAMSQASQSLLGKGLATADANRARRFFEQAIVADPANAAAFSALGDLYGKQAKTDLARKYYRLALDIDPLEPSALAGAATMDIADGKTEAARDRLRKLKASCPACRQTRDIERRLSPGAAAPSSPHP
jgi:tetratricopeptide (TPR) repeat protein